MERQGDREEGGNGGDGKDGEVWLASDSVHKCCWVCVLMKLTMASGPGPREMG